MDKAVPPDVERALQTRLTGLPKLSRHALLDEFEKVYGRTPPPRLSASILALAVAYRLQEQVYGGLKPEIRRALLSGKAVPEMPKAPGTVLIREWHGVEHIVTIHADHIEYRGERYTSLSRLAFVISGCKQSGPKFFGMRKKRQ